MTNDQILAAKAAIIGKAWADPAYLKTLVSNPKEIIAREFAVDLPAGLTVTVLADTADTLNLVLADPADLPDEEKAGPKAAILAKAWADPAFKKALLADPAAAIAALGAKIRPGVRIKAVEQTADHAFIVIPARPASLSDADLDKVAGGMSRGNKELLIDAGITAGIAIACPEGMGEVAVAFGLERAYENRGTIEHDGVVAGKEIGKGAKKAGHAISHAAHKVFHGW